MKEGQPALVYLVPSTLLTVTIVSLIRKEFCNLWHGTYVSWRFLYPKPNHNLIQILFLTWISTLVVVESFQDWNGVWKIILSFALFQQLSGPSNEPLVESDFEEDCVYDRDGDGASTNNTNNVNESRTDEREKLIN